MITNDSMPSFCGYPGFDLLCNNHDKLLINLPKLGVFSVEEINYIKQELWLNDPNNCLPRKLLSLNGSSFVGKSLFNPVLEQDYWLFNCSNDFFSSFDYLSVEIIGCLSGQDYGVFASPLEKIVKGNSSLCSKLGHIKVPRGSYDLKDFPLNLRGDIKLTWSQPYECWKCYMKNGRCGFKNYGANLDVECFNLPRNGLSKPAIIAIALAFAAPLGLVSICIIYFVIKAIIYRRSHGSGVTPAIALQDNTHTQLQSVIVQGLDRSIIESYPKVVLGSSRRLPKPDDLHCPICLGEYLPKESLRTIPNCSHCFHAECIDEWLQLNASCPVCRNSPSRISQNNDV
ncbi:unnamed protein product [Amaranthus hypochondriacus]